MYGKIFTQMYDGTLVTNWEALITFQQMIVLCDSEGMLDMTPSVLSSRTGIPIEIINRGIEILEAEDPHSRSKLENGKRIVLIDDDRPWGWYLVNHKKYRDMISREQKREKDRERIAQKRLLEKQGCSELSQVSQVSPNVVNVAHTDTDTDTDTDTNTKKETMSDSKESNPKLSAEEKRKKVKRSHGTVIAIYHDVLPELPKVALSRWPGSTREKDLSKRLSENSQYKSREFWEEFFNTVKKDAFWMGDNQRGWKADLGWLVKRGNFDKVLERAISE